MTPSRSPMPEPTFETRSHLGKRAEPYIVRDTLTYEESKALVRSASVADRLRVAKDPDTLPELLFFLARDESDEVRAAVALHAATPRKADLMLATDSAPDIRRFVATKVSAQLRSLPEPETVQAWQLTVSVLEALARDDAAEVRRLVAELARSMERVPAALALQLARDADPRVAEPALGYPGTFADAELVAIVEEAHDPRIIEAVARRPGIGPSVAEAVLATGDEAAVAIMLANKTADISDHAMSQIIDVASDHVTWHEPLVTRPKLTPDWVRKLAGFVGEALVSLLRGRSDVDPAAFGPAAPPRAPTTTQIYIPPAETPGERARRLFAQNKLDEDCIGEALGLDQPFVLAALALRAKESPTVIQKMLTAQSAKALVSLAWKAGLSPRFASQLQVRSARLPPKSRIVATDGLWPLKPEEMAWQVDFFRTLAAGG